MLRLRKGGQVSQRTPYISATTQSSNHMDNRIILHVVVTQSATSFQLLASKDEPDIVGMHSVLFGCQLREMVDCIGQVNIQRKRLPPQILQENLTRRSLLWKLARLNSPDVLWCLFFKQILVHGKCQFPPALSRPDLYSTQRIMVDSHSDGVTHFPVGNGIEDVRVPDLIDERRGGEDCCVVVSMVYFEDEEATVLVDEVGYVC